MAAFFKFNQFVEDLANGKHDLSADVLKIYLTNATPDAALDAIKTDLAEITNENGYTAPVTVTITSSTETGGTYTLVGDDLIPMVTATGNVGPFQWAVLYNSSSGTPVDALIGAWDYGSSISLANGETFDVDFGASILSLT